MNNQRWQEAKNLFHAAIDCDPAERAAFLYANCSDENLRREVEELIAANEEAGDFIVAPALVDAGLVFSQTNEDAFEDETTANIGRRVGQYELTREIGRGGMGVVYLAVRADDEFKQQVAVKIIKRGMDTDFIVRRFRHERQILASLNHPNIARLLDGGTTEEGLPYFVMEYVEGEPINKYCVAHNLDISERLKLFRQVCSAVSYAHQHLIVHRDIKPSNIIVTKEGEPKLLDFGIAKLLNPEQNEATETTTEAFRLMTPEYASPEQLRGQTITTASDVYSLGVVLYELLSGHRPYKKLESRLPEEIIQAILTEEPIKPSEAATQVSTRRRGDAGTRRKKQETADDKHTTKDQTTNRQSAIGNRQLKGDLDNIVLKALRKEQTRRYASVQEFSEDIRRHLKGLPVTARQDTFSYRASKFVQRHKVGAIAAVVVIFTLLSATAITAWQAHVAKRERDKAERRFNDVRKLANSFMFEFHDSIQDLPGSTSARELVVKKALEYLDNLASEDTQDPSLRFELAAAYMKVGDIQGRAGSTNLGDTAGALSSYQRAVGILEPLAKAEPNNVRYKKLLARAFREIGSINGLMGVFESALNNNRQALVLWEELTAFAPEDVSIKISLAESYKGLGDIVSSRGDIEGGLRNYRKAAEICESVLASNPKDDYARGMLLYAYEAIGTTLGNPNYTNLGDTSGALEIYRKQLSFSTEMLREDETSVYYLSVQAYSLKTIGEVLTATGDWKAAIENYRQALTIQQRLVETDSQNVVARSHLAYMLTNIGEALAETKQVDAALEHHRQAIDILTKLCEADKENASFLTYLARAYQRNGDALVKADKVNEAMEFYNKALASDEGMAKEDVNNMDIRLALANDYTKIAKAHIVLASSASASPKKRKELLQEAKDRFDESKNVYLDMQNHNLRTKPINDALNSLSQETAKCDAALAKLQTK